MGNPKYTRSSDIARHGVSACQYKSCNYETSRLKTDCNGQM